MADQFVGPYSASLPEAIIEAMGVKPPSVDGSLLGLLGTYTSMRSVHSILAHGGPTDQSLTDTGGGYNLRGAGFSYHTTRPSQPMVSTFHLRVPPDLQLNKIPPLDPNFKIKNLWPPRGLPTTRSSTEATIYA
jgi:hypothetical protein